MSRVAIIGGGPAGMTAALEASKRGHAATLFERNEKLGKKLYISGKGRCNFTNSAGIEDFFSNIPRNPRFLYSALYGYTNEDAVRFLEDAGVKTKVERGGRIFPASDKSSDVTRAYELALARVGVRISLCARVENARREGEEFLIRVEGKEYPFDKLILATGGMSYPMTGSTGDGYEIARSFGHAVTPLLPSLVSFETIEDWPPRLMGLSLRNVTLRAYDRRGKKRYEELGEMLFTHYGVSGPLVLSASACLADEPGGARLSIDLKPGLSEEELDRRLLRDFEANINRQFRNALDALLPQKLIPVIVELSGIPERLEANGITREMRRNLCILLKNLEMTVKRARPIEEAIVTRGGIKVQEIDPSTMESKLVPGLFFAGEIIDVDGYTGGFNIQIACSTGALAGRSV
ncbi:MAG TPA: NAD(P)/FAD-dependent oxidoreductase [Clostridia bacterium]|nr:NAD(P)/FAD-dependent oxidoreductase [Clostridia bacterium]